MHRTGRVKTMPDQPHPKLTLQFDWLKTMPEQPHPKSHSRFLPFHDVDLYALFNESICLFKNSPIRLANNHVWPHSSTTAVFDPSFIGFLSTSKNENDLTTFSGNITDQAINKKLKMKISLTNCQILSHPSKSGFYVSLLSQMSTSVCKISKWYSRDVANQITLQFDWLRAFWPKMWHEVMVSAYIILSESYKISEKLKSIRRTIVNRETECRKDRWLWLHRTIAFLHGQVG